MTLNRESGKITEHQEFHVLSYDVVVDVETTVFPEQVGRMYNRHTTTLFIESLINFNRYILLLSVVVRSVTPDFSISCNLYCIHLNRLRVNE